MYIVGTQCRNIYMCYYLLNLTGGGWHSFSPFMRDTTKLMHFPLSTINRPRGLFHHLHTKCTCTVHVHMCRVRNVATSTLHDVTCKCTHTWTPHIDSYVKCTYMHVQIRTDRLESLEIRTTPGWGGSTPVLRRPTLL